jgi:predicted RNase H-like nuclease
VFVGVDLAWGEGTPVKPPNETGVAVIDGSGRVRDAGWTRGVADTVDWVVRAAGDGPALLFVDAPLVVSNPGGQCETAVGRCYGRWKVSANTTNLASRALAGVALRRLLEERGWAYHDGRDGPPAGGRAMSECYPYTTLVGAPELGYFADGARPRYKRRPRTLAAADWRAVRTAACDELIHRMAGLASADPPLRLDSHPVTRRLREEPSPVAGTAYKHREDLIDALLCAWTAALWARHGLARCQALGARLDPGPGPLATIIAPATGPQRRLDD